MAGPGEVRTQTIANTSDEASGWKSPSESRPVPRRARRFGRSADPTTLGRFAILRRLGAGGMGVVYEAEDPRRDERVAVKTLHGLDPGALYRFKQEFRALADVSHPNIVTLFELFSEDDRLFFTMELLEGVSFVAWARGGAALRSWTEDDLGARDRLDVPALRDALAQLVEGLAHLHEHGKLHRDIKPSNVLVTTGGRVVLLDFGLVRDDAGQLEQTVEVGVVGTPAYMSPEQAAGSTLTAASDWYSVGVMLYKALTGRLPVEGNNAVHLMRAKQDARPVPPSEHDPDVPADLERLCLDLLDPDPDLRPDAAEVRRRLDPGASRPATVPVRNAPAFVGRAEHKQALTRAFDEASRGVPVIAFVSGLSGMGKTSLVRHVLAEIRGRGDVTVLRGRCHERESVPYKAVDTIVDELSRHLRRLPVHEALDLLPDGVHALGRLFPVLQRVEAVNLAPRTRETLDPFELREQAFQALKELLTRMTARRPLVLHADDLQWGDRDSVALLHELFRGPDAVPCLLVAGYRAEELAASATLRELVEHAPGLSRRLQIHEIDVGPLEPSEAVVLAGNALRAAGADPKMGEALAREGEGNPYFIGELVRHAVGGASLSQLGQRSLRLEDVLLARIDALSEAARDLLRVVAVAGRRVQQGVARRATRTPVDRASFTVLRNQRFIRTRGLNDEDSVEPYHDRIREIVVSDLPEDQLRALHRALGDSLLETGGADPVDLLWHYRAAGEQTRAAGFAKQAAERAASSLAFERAAELYRVARELAGDGGDAAEIGRSLGDALANAGRGPEAADAYLDAAERTEGQDQLDLWIAAARALLLTGHRDRGREVLGRALDRVGLRLPRSQGQATRALLWARTRLKWRGMEFEETPVESIPRDQAARIDACWAAARGLYLGDLLAGAYFQSEHLLLALEAGDPEQVALGMAFEARSASFFGGKGLVRAREMMSRVRGVSSTLRSPLVLAAIDSSASLVSLMSGDWRKAVEQADRAESLLRERCTGTVAEIYDAHAHATAALTYLGEVDELGVRVRRAAAEAEARQNRYHQVIAHCMVAFPVLVAEGDPDEADRVLEACLEVAEDDIEIHQLQPAVAACSLRLARGDGEGALAELERRGKRVEKLLLLRALLPKVSWMDLRVRCHLAAAGRAPSRLKAAEKEAGRLSRLAFPSALPLAQLAFSGIAAARGDRADAVRKLRTAVGTLQEADMRLHTALARIRLGELLGGDEGGELRDRGRRFLRKRELGGEDALLRCHAPGFPAGD